MNFAVHRGYGIRVLGFVVIAAAVLSGAGIAGASGYTFKKIVDDQGAFESFSIYSAQPLNNSGEAAFYAVRTNLTSDYFKSDGNQTTRVSTDPSHFLDSQTTGGINDGGSVVFRGDDNAFQGGLWAGSGGGLTSVLYESLLDPNPAWLITGRASINDSNQVAFEGGWTSDPTDPTPVTRYGFYRVSGGSVTVMAESGGTYTGAGNAPPALNDAGQAAFMMSTAGSGYHLLRYDSPGLTTIATGWSGSQFVSMNDLGEVAFINQNGTAVNVFRQGGVQTIASTADGFDFVGDHGDGVFINDAGDVAFWGNVNTYNGNPVQWQGVYTGTDLVHDRVMIDGDSLLGRTVSNLRLLGINDSGQILMSARLSGPENWDILFLATPPLAGDFQEDGDVDDADLTFWRGGLGTTGTAYHMQGDADNDDDVDGRDFLIWQQQYGTPAPAASAVPEPTGAALITAAVIVAQRRRRTVLCSQPLEISINPSKWECTWRSS
jgi:hypothetical protein